MAGGRPTKYKKEYCDRLTEWMGKGLSFESFAGDISVDRDTIYEWVKVHKEFSDAKKIGSGKSQVFWEKIGVAGSSGKLPGFQTGAWIFNMKNRFGWRDKHDVITRDETFKQPSEMDEIELDERMKHAEEVIAKYASKSTARSGGSPKVSGSVPSGTKKSEGRKSPKRKKATSKTKSKG